MEDLSHLLPGNPLAPTSQHQGTMTDNTGAMTAPGTPTPLSEAAGPVPVLHTIDHGTPTTLSPEGAPASSPWTDTAGRPWAAAADQRPASGNVTQSGSPWSET